MSASGDYLTWENFEELIEHGVPAVYRIPGPQDVDLFVDEAGGRIGLQTPIAADLRLPPSRLSEMELVRITREGIPFLEISTTSRSLYREFYSFLLSVAGNIRGGSAPLAAVSSAISDWRQLLRAVALLTEEEQLGLMGELWLLERLSTMIGPEALHAWTGPLGEPHDFRQQATEIEVKVTRSPRRQHVITNLVQLLPSLGHDLFVLSLQLEPTGSGKGFSLSSQVARLRDLLGSLQADVTDFDHRLETAWGYRDVDAEHYSETFQLRTVPVLVRVDDKCPSITPDLISSIGTDRAQRISAVRYTVDLTGLGSSDGSGVFQQVLLGKGDG